MVTPGALPKISLTGISSRVLKSETTVTSPNDFPVPFHKIRNTNSVDPSIGFHLLTVVVKVPPERLGVSVVYTTEPVSESWIVVLRISSSPSEVKDRFILKGALGSEGDKLGDPKILAPNCACIYGYHGAGPRDLELSSGLTRTVHVASTQNGKGKEHGATPIPSRQRSR